MLVVYSIVLLFSCTGALADSPPAAECLIRDQVRCTVDQFTTENHICTRWYYGDGSLVCWRKNEGF